jgi:hypothetical protein
MLVGRASDTAYGGYEELPALLYLEIRSILYHMAVANQRRGGFQLILFLNCTSNAFHVRGSLRL